MPFTVQGFTDDTGAWDYDAPDALKVYLSNLKGQEWIATFKRRPRRQGRQSMRYYRGVVVPDIARACGYSDEDDFPSVHESLAWRFLRMSDHPELGYPRRRSTKKDELTQEEMSAYIDQCILWAEAEIVGCRVRRPEEVDMDDVYGQEFDS